MPVNFLRHWFQSKSSKRANRRTTRSRRTSLRAETLEQRMLLATDLGAIAGNVFNDVDNDSIQDAGELGIAGVTVQLSGGALGAPVTSVTDATGAYRFDGLMAGTYTVEQLPPPPTGFTPRPGSSPQTVTITALQAMGRQGTIIDSFGGTVQMVTAENPASMANPNPNSSSVVDASALGGTRDVEVESVSSPGQAAIFSNIAGNPGVLSFDPINNTMGRYRVVWDGDSDPNVLMGTGGLNGGAGVDLTDGGLSDRIQLMLGIQGAGQQMTMRVHTSATQVSEATFSFPNSLMPDQEVIVPYASFAQSAAAGVTGPADFTQVLAVELEHTATVLAADASLDIMNALGPNVQQADFANLSVVDVQVEKTVNDATPVLGQTVNFNITATNNGPGTATGVVVTDLVPAGMTLTGNTPSQGTYDTVSGQWSIGTLANGASVTLQLSATVDTVGTKTNTATVTGINENDTNPSNNTASAALTPETVDLQVTKTVSNSTPLVGDQVTFTIAVTNNGPSVATGVVFSDVLPTGTTFVSSSATVGSYSNATGLWTIGTLANGGTATLSLVASVDTEGTKTNTVTLNAVNETDTVAPNNTSSAQLIPQANNVNVAVAKTVSNAAPNLGDVVSFDVTVTNQGPLTATDVQIQDNFPSGILLQSATPTQGTFTSATGIWNVGTLVSGASAQLTLTGRVTSLAKQTNTASLILAALDQNDTNAADNDAMAMLTALPPVLVGKRGIAGIFVPRLVEIDGTVAWALLPE